MHFCYVSGYFLPKNRVFVFQSTCAECKWAFMVNNFSESYTHAESWVIITRLSYICVRLLHHAICLTLINTLRPRQNDRLFADDTFKRIFFNENIRISIKLSLKFVPKGSINNNPALVLIMAWCRPGDKPLSEPMLVKQLTHICVTRPQWVKDRFYAHRFPIAIR